jgi:hypothetical protein
VKGSKLTGPNGKSIFLPAAGYRDATSLLDVGSLGFYWSSSLSTGYPGGAWSLGFYSGNVYGGNDYRCYGQSIRPVSE